MEPRDETRAAAEAPPPPAAEVAHDLRWAQDLRSSIRCACALLALLVLTDGVAGTLTGPRALLWLALAALLFLILCPARIAAGEGWLSSHGPLGTRRVRTDRLVSVRCLGGVGQRLVLRDTFGARLELDPDVLAASPGLWHRLDEDARISARRGTLTSGESVLRRVSERIDRETARTVFKLSGLD
ncbi:hypothetical protein ACFV06_22320 [Streptomyces sp. NPDC059618]|uniref:hypothetical protein n=1 Tax=Streptomyces sp. NPDC059618 TaxID=3346887 RepID=UPI0036C4351B